MFVRRVLPLRIILPFTWRPMLIMLVWSAFIVWLYDRGWVGHVGIPFLPVGIIGTAVAFYVGFKNNSSYDRLWEARRIWGGIVNMSRNWAASVLGFVTDGHAHPRPAAEELRALHRELVFRHLAWVNALRHGLLVRKSWEHDYRFNRRARAKLHAAMRHPSLEEELARFLPEHEVRAALAFRNPAVQLLTAQSERLRALKEQGLIEEFRHIELQRVIAELFNEQGRAERIKNFPFPRQYGAFSAVFVSIFILLTPLGLVFEFGRVDPGMIWAAVPLSLLIAWVFVTMEMVGDYSENPFEELINDIPMFAMSRGIETDLRQMIGDTDLPAPVKDVDGILL